MTVYTQIVNVGSSFEQTFVYTLNDEPVDLTGWGAVFRLRDESDRVISTVRYGDTGDRALTIDTSSGVIDVTMVASATSGFSAKTGTFELEIYELTNTGRVFRIIDGAVRYRPRGRAMLDNTVCVIRSTSNAVTVETQNVSQYQRIDRGPPGSRGVEGPTVPVDNTRLGAVPRLQVATARHVVRSDGTSLDESKETVPVAAFNSVYSTDQERLDAAAALASSRNCSLTLENRRYTGLRYLNFKQAQGVHIDGAGGPSFSTGGTTFEFDYAPTPVTTTSASNVSVAWGFTAANTVTEKTFVVASATGITVNTPVKATSSAGTMYGRVKSIVGTTLVMYSYAGTGSGSSSSWTIENAVTPLIDFRSSKGCGIHGINVRINIDAINDVISTAAVSGDTDSFHLEDVMVYDFTYRHATGFYLNNLIGGQVDVCRTSGCVVGLFAGNGPLTISNFIANDFSGVAMELVVISATVSSCTWEPGSDLSGAQIQECLYIHDNSGGTVSLQGNVFNDFQLTATGRLIRAKAIGLFNLGEGNVLSTDATQATVLITGCQGIAVWGTQWPPAVTRAIEIDSSGGSIPFAVFGPRVFSGTTFLTGGASITRKIDLLGTITRTDLTTLLGLTLDFAQFDRTFSNQAPIVPEEGIDFTSGVDISWNKTNIYNTAAGNGNIYTVAAIDDGIILSITTTKQITVRHNNSTGSTGSPYRKVFTKTGADVVVAANSSIQLRYRSRLGGWDLENVYP